MKKLRNLAIATGVGAALFLLLAYLEVSTPGLDLGATKYVLPMVLSSGLFAGLNARAGNRRVPVANDARKAELLGFPPRDGCGWVVMVRDKATVASSLGFDVAVDNKVITQLMPKRFTMIALPSGTHQLFADVAGAPGASAIAPLDVAIRPGEILIFAIRASMGLMRTSLRLDPAADSPAMRRALARMQLVEPEGQGS